MAGREPAQAEQGERDRRIRLLRVGLQGRGGARAQDAVPGQDERTLGLGDQVRYTVGEAVQTLGREGGEFDLIFNDIDKRGYPSALPVIESKLRSGGLLITDNLLWSGRIFDKKNRTPDTQGIRKFTSLVMKSPNWSASIVPIRDGVLVARKR